MIEPFEPYKVDPARLISSLSANKISMELVGISIKDWLGENVHQKQMFDHLIKQQVEMINGCKKEKLKECLIEKGFYYFANELDIKTKFPQVVCEKNMATGWECWFVNDGTPEGKFLVAFKLDYVYGTPPHMAVCGTASYSFKILQTEDYQQTLKPLWK